MQEVRFERVTSCDGILEVLNLFTPYLRTLSTGVVNKEEYSNKILKNGILIKLVVNRDIVGFASFYCNDLKEKNAYLTFIAVSDMYRSRGLGKLILDEVKKISIMSGMKGLKLEVRKENKKVCAFYKKQGFEEIMIDDKNDSIKMYCKLY